MKAEAEGELWEKGICGAWCTQKEPRRLHIKKLIFSVVVAFREIQFILVATAHNIFISICDMTGAKL